MKIEPTDMMCDLMQVGAAILALVASTITGSVGSMRTSDDRFLGAAAYQGKSVMCRYLDELLNSLSDCL
jgi:hypothetical protein